MRTYELLYLTPLLDADAPRVTIRDRAANIIQDAGGTVVATRDIARQRLAYPIKRQQAGEYALVEFTAPGAAVRVIERELRLAPDILRIMVTAKVEKARAIGHTIEAMERAKAQEHAAKAAVAERAAQTATAAAEPPQVIEDLDKKLEEILGKEMV